MHMWMAKILEEYFSRFIFILTIKLRFVGMVSHDPMNLVTTKEVKDLSSYMLRICISSQLE
jgi:hypothetical protein